MGGRGREGGKEGKGREKKRKESRLVGHFK